MENNVYLINQEKKNRKCIYLLLAIIIIVVASVVIYVLLNNDKNNNSSTNENSNSNKQSNDKEQTIKINEIEAKEIVEEIFNNVFDKINSSHDSIEYSFWGETEEKTYDGEEYSCTMIQSGDLYSEFTSNAIQYLLTTYFLEFDASYYECGWIEGLSKNHFVNSIFGATDVTDITITIDSFNDEEIIATVISKNGTKTNATGKLTLKYDEYESQVGGLEPESSWKIDEIKES